MSFTSCTFHHHHQADQVKDEMGR